MLGRAADWMFGLGRAASWMQGKGHGLGGRGAQLEVGLGNVWQAYYESLD